MNPLPRFKAMNDARRHFLSVAEKYFISNPFERRTPPYRSLAPALACGEEPTTAIGHYLPELTSLGYNHFGRNVDVDLNPRNSDANGC